MHSLNYVRVNFMLPRSIYMALKSLIPERKRSQVVSNLLKNEIEKREKELFNIAKSIENDTALNKDLKEWDSTLGDGIGDIEWK